MVKQQSTYKTTATTKTNVNNGKINNGNQQQQQQIQCTGNEMEECNNVVNEQRKQPNQQM